jgi:micrococcal nuclease
MQQQQQEQDRPQHQQVDADLLACTYDNTPAASLDGLVVTAKCVRVYDGDTAHFAFREYPGGAIRRRICRMAGYNSAELRTKDAHERATAERARDRLRALVCGEDGTLVTLRCGKADKYGRVLVEVECAAGNVREIMLAEGHGKPYDGRGPKTF